jgi:hypothetical protein
MTNHEIIRKLIGKIEPVGETNTDAERLTNLKETINLTRLLLQDIHDLTFLINDGRYSMKQASIVARKFLNEISNEFPILIAEK